MRSIVLFEDSGFVNLLPLVYWRTVFELRCGRKTLLDGLTRSLGEPVTGLWVRDWIAPVAQERYQLPANTPIQAGALLINGRCLLDRGIDFHPAPFVGTCGERIAYIACDADLAGRLRPQDLLDAERSARLLASAERGPVEVTMVRYPWDLVERNGEQLAADWSAGDRAMEGQVSSSALLIETDSIHIGQRAVVEPMAVIDAQEGPVYLGEGARIRPHSHLTGPAYIGPGSVVNPHSSIRGGTAIGPMCKVGGEINGCIISGYSNKQHEGFLGHAYVGSWVNLGASTVNSNLKNTYGPVRVSVNGREVDTGLTFFGSIIGDHVKTGIQQTLPTGAVIGFASMVACSRIPPKFVPSFSWLADAGRTRADPKRLLATARRVMQRRDVTCSEAEAALFLEVARRAPQYETNEPL